MTTAATQEFLAEVMRQAEKIVREKTAEKKRSAIAQRRAAGLPVGRPRGVSPETLAVMAEWRARGWTIVMIADRLNSRGVPTPSGRGRWDENKVWDQLAREGLHEVVDPGAQQVRQRFHNEARRRARMQKRALTP